MKRKSTIDDWRKAVYEAEHITDATRVLLLLLADYMGPDLKVSVARPTLAKRLKRSERRIADRLREAVGEAPHQTDEDRCRRLLDRVARGQKHVQAVYQGLMPDAVSVTPVRPAENRAQQDTQEHAENAEIRPAENGDSGFQQDTRGSRLIGAHLSVGPHGRDGGSNEKTEDHPRRGSLTVCRWEHAICPDDCADHPSHREESA